MPGARVVDFAVAEVAQPTVVQTWSAPETTVQARVFGDSVRVQAVAVVLRTTAVSRGRVPAAYLSASVSAVTASWSRLQAIGALLGVVDDGDGRGVPPVPPAARGLLEPPEHDTAITSSTTARTASRSTRRVQYTRGGNGPTGCSTARESTPRGYDPAEPAWHDRPWHDRLAMPDPFAAAVTRWYRGHARDLPWRRENVDAWGVVVSEFMLQQTPVVRVVPVWQDWLRRWPTPASLAGASAGDAVRAWGRLGYPRRALRLHAAATAMVERHGGAVPSSYDDLRALPGVGDYTAAAVASFAFGARRAVLDTNVRRVYRRVFDGSDDMTTAPTVAERAAALDRVPMRRPAEYSVAVMELGAVVCTARAPACAVCPVAAQCSWVAAGRPVAVVGRPVQRYDGTDRQARGRLLAVLRDQSDPVPAAELDLVWADAAQRARALDGLVADGLVEPLADGRFRLPA